jgi:hypothetical protein
MLPRLCPVALTLLVATTLLPACASRQTTPPEVRAAYDELVASLEVDAPGFSLLRLEAFARRHADDAIAAEVARDADIWRQRLQPAYRSARDLVRQGQFDLAETILKDLSLVPGEPVGAQAAEFLAFDFQKLRASRLLATGDSTGAETAARHLLDQAKAREEVAAAQQLLDMAAMAELGARMTRTTALQSSARALHVFLLSSYADNGQYPQRFSLDGPDLAYLRDTGSLRAIDRLEDYRATPDTFSVTVVGKDGQRLRVTNTGVEPAPVPPAHP